MEEHKREIIKTCLENWGSIFIREQLDGKWASYSLNEIADHDPRLAFDHVLRLMDEDRMPVVYTGPLDIQGD
jgi:hypothetical protein